MLGWGKTETLNCYQDDSCIKICSDESHFNAVLIVRDKARRQCPQTTICEKSRQPKRNRPEVLLLAILLPDGFKPLCRKASSPEVQTNGRHSNSERTTPNKTPLTVRFRHLPLCIYLYNSLFIVSAQPPPPPFTILLLLFLFVCYCCCCLVVGRFCFVFVF